MAENVHIELISAGVRELLQGSESQALLEGKAARIAAAAGVSGGKFGHNVQVGKTRARAIVFTADFAAELAEAKHRALTKAIDAGRG